MKYDHSLDASYNAMICYDFAMIFRVLGEICYDAMIFLHFAMICYDFVTKCYDFFINTMIFLKML